MELAIPTTIARRLSPASLCPRCSFHVYSKSRRQLPRRILRCSNTKPLRIESSIDRDSSCSPILNKECSVSIWEDNNFVEVIGIGSRKDAVFDFCLGSPSVSLRLRFWNIVVEEMVKVRLEQKSLGDDITKRTVEVPLAMPPHSKAVILVAGAAYGSEYTYVHDILEATKLANGFVVSIILKPFRFEGRRRQDEVTDLLHKLQEVTDFCITVDADTLLEKDLVTLDEALQTANNAVLMALNAISVLTSELNIKFLDLTHGSMKELKVPDVQKILGSYKEGKIGYGAGYDIETSVVQAIYDCPFLGSGLKDLDGIVVFILASSSAIKSSDVHTILHKFRQATKWEGEIITSVVHEPNTAPNLITTTVFTLGCIRSEPSPKGGIFSGLVQSFPFIFNILVPRSQPDNIQENNSPDSTISLQGKRSTKFEILNVNSMNRSAVGFDSSSSGFQSVLSNNTNATNLLKNYGGTEQTEAEYPEANFCKEISEGPPTLHREPLIGRNRGSGNPILGEAADETTDYGATLMLENLNTYKLPVGVKPSGDQEDVPDGSSVIHHKEKKNKFEMQAENQFSLSMSSDTSTDASLQALMENDGSTSAIQNGVYPDVSKKNGALSARAASMLEAERDFQKKWSPIVEIKYHGGVYIGRCQGGLPEGKGRLSLIDGSMYDGMWRYGKRSGMGTFCFSNGDVYRGSWRDDVMHGKGWFYFHTGDRWFVNFWKGKANGEGRFYSKNGDIFFGHFRDGWRDGHFLYIDVGGSRYLEIWDGGILVSCKQLESDEEVG